MSAGRLLRVALESQTKSPRQVLTIRLALHRGAVLESVCYRIALISALRSKRLGGKTVGLMVTASHNPEEVSKDKSMLQLRMSRKLTPVPPLKTGQRLEGGRLQR